MWSNNQTNWTALVPFQVPIQGQQNPNPSFIPQSPFLSDESRKRKAVEFDPTHYNSNLNVQSYLSSNIPPPIRPSNPNSFTFMQENRPNNPTSFSVMQENRPHNPNLFTSMQENRPNNPNSFTFLHEVRPNNPNSFTFSQEIRPNNPNSLTFMQENRPNNLNSFTFTQEIRPNNPNSLTFMQENRPNNLNSFTFTQEVRPNNPNSFIFTQEVRPNNPNSFTSMQENRPNFNAPILTGSQSYYNGIRPSNTEQVYSSNEMNINNAPNCMNFMNNISENRPPFMPNIPFPSEIHNSNLTDEKITNISGINPSITGNIGQFHSSNETQTNIVQNFMNSINSMSGSSENRPSEIPKLNNENCTAQNCTDSTSKFSEEMKLENEGSVNGNNNVNISGNINGKLNEGKLKGITREKLWDGTIQLNTKTTVSVVAFFKSGEKNKNIVWPDSLEIKGKVRLEAFEKFIQELPRSRSRSLMVISLCWKITSSSSGLTGMKEVAKGYTKSEKVGFSEISPGLDLYICPRTDKIITILAQHGFFKGIMAIQEDHDSLIGCVVSRKNNTKNEKHSNPGSSNSLSKSSDPSLSKPSNSSEISCIDEAKITENRPKSNSDKQEKIVPASSDVKVKDLNPKKQNKADDDLPEFDFPVKTIPFISRIPFDSKKDNNNNNNNNNNINEDDDDMPEWSPPRYTNVGTETSFNTSRPVPESRRTRYLPLSSKTATENQTEASKSVPKTKENPKSDNKKSILGPPPDRNSRFSNNSELKSSSDVESRKERYRWHRK